MVRSHLPTHTPQKLPKKLGRRMARTVRDANLETRTARLRLPIRSEPYWRGLEKGFALGYRRRGKGGTWLARRRPAAGGYAEHKIGTSDDLQWRQVRLSHPSGRRDAYSTGARHRPGRQVDRKENRGLASRPCPQAGARPLQARSQGEPPQGRQERRRRARAPRHREPNPDGPESRAEPCLEIQPRRERRCLAPREAVPGGRNGACPLPFRG